jgi:hypothetical protein
MMASNFDKLAATLAGKPGVTDPKGLAAVIGRKKFGGARMAKAAAKGVPAAKVRAK